MRILLLLLLAVILVCGCFESDDSWIRTVKLGDCYVNCVFYRDVLSCDWTQKTCGEANITLPMIQVNVQMNITPTTLPPVMTTTTTVPEEGWIKSMVKGWLG
jgi:hypothetical protein